MLAAGGQCRCEVEAFAFGEFGRSDGQARRVAGAHGVQKRADGFERRGARVVVGEQALVQQLGQRDGRQVVSEPRSAHAEQAQQYGGRVDNGHGRTVRVMPGRRWCQLCR